MKIKSIRRGESNLRRWEGADVDVESDRIDYNIYIDT